MLQAGRRAAPLNYGPDYAALQSFPGAGSLQGFLPYRSGHLVHFPEHVFRNELEAHAQRSTWVSRSLPQAVVIAFSGPGTAGHPRQSQSGSAPCLSRLLQLPFVRAASGLRKVKTNIESRWGMCDGPGAADGAKEVPTLQGFG